LPNTTLTRSGDVIILQRNLSSSIGDGRPIGLQREGENRNESFHEDDIRNVAGVRADFDWRICRRQREKRKKMVTFPEDMMVKGTLVKAGDYEVKFDEATGTLSILRNGR